MVQHHHAIFRRLGVCVDHAHADACGHDIGLPLDCFSDARAAGKG